MPTMKSKGQSLSKADFAALVETGGELASEVGLTPLIHRILERATQLTDSPDGSLILYSDKRKALYFAHAVGLKAPELLARWGENGPETIPLDDSKAGEVFRTGRPIVVAAVQDDPRHFDGVDRQTGRKTQSMICVPMAVAGERIGVVQILNKRTGAYNPRDLLLLEQFAPQAAIAIRNARLLEDLFAHMGLFASQATRAGLADYLDERSRPARSEMLSILFADMRGSTQLWHVGNRLERTQELINQFLGVLADAVLANQGIVNKFLGDGLMALFRGPDHAARAVRCGLAMVDGFAALRARWDRESNVSLGFLDLGIGVATDTVVLGSIGSHRVREFTALGTAVNLAAYLVDHARGGRRVLIDRMTFRAAQGVVGAFDGPEPFELKKPGQTVGLPYELYHVRGLQLGSGSAAAGPGRSAPRVLPSLSGRQIE